MLLAGRRAGVGADRRLQHPLRLGRVRRPAVTERAGTQWTGPARCSSRRPGRARRGRPRRRARGRGCSPRCWPATRTRSPPSDPVLFDLALWPGNALALGLLGAGHRPGRARRAAPRRGPDGRGPAAAGRRSATEITWRALVHALQTGALRVTAPTQRGSPAVVPRAPSSVVLLPVPGVALVATGPLGARVDRVVGLPAAAGRRGPRRRVRRVLAVARPPPTDRDPARRRDRLRGRGDLRAARRARPGADPVPRRDHDTRRCSCWCCDACPPVIGRRTTRRAAGSPGARSRRRRGASSPLLGVTARRRPHTARDRRSRSRPGLRARRGPERRQRDAGRHPRLGHHGRDVRAAGRRDRRRQPGLHRRRTGTRPAGAAPPSSGRTNRSGRRCPERRRPAAAAAVAGVGRAAGGGAGCAARPWSASPVSARRSPRRPSGRCCSRSSPG